MTRNQIAYWDYRERQRSNLRNEQITQEHNVATRQETARHDVAMETETNRSNLATEDWRNRSLLETQRHAIATEQETLRNHLATENLTAAQIRELSTHNRATEALQSRQIAETHRANIANELLGINTLEVRREELDESQRRTDLQHSISQAQQLTNAYTFGETERHNQAMERIAAVKGFGGALGGLLNFFN